jgi:hypothetical protein
VAWLSAWGRGWARIAHGCHPIGMAPHWQRQTCARGTVPTSVDSSGKTTLLSCVCASIPARERMAMPFVRDALDRAVRSGPGLAGGGQV